MDGTKLHRLLFEVLAAFLVVGGVALTAGGLFLDNEWGRILVDLRVYRDQWIVLLISSVSSYFLLYRLSPFAVAALLALLITTLCGGGDVLLGVVFLALSFIATGRIFLSRTGVGNEILLLCGAVILGTALSLTAHLKINYAGVWAVILGLPIIISRNYFIDFLRRLELTDITGDSRRVEWDERLLFCLVFGVASIHLVLAFMPEVGHDALASHLYIPWYLWQNSEWHFNPTMMIGSVSPLLVNWIYALGFGLGGEILPRLLNGAAVLGLAYFAACSSVLAGCERRYGLWAALIFLTTPIALSETSSLWVDAWWALLLVSAPFS